jgi:hypothetical protein
MPPASALALAPAVVSAISLAVTLALPVHAEVRGAIVVSDRSEVRVRDSNEINGRAVDLETSPALGVRLEGRRWALDAAYAPRFTGRALDEASSTTRDLLHGGTVSATWIDRRVRFVAREELLYGDMSFTSLALGSAVLPSTTPGQPSLQTLFGPASIRFTSMRTLVSARVQASREVAVTSSFEHVRTGGIDALSRSVFPMQEGPRLEESVEYASSRVDWLTTSVRASRLVYSSGPESTLFELDQGWRHAYGAHSFVTVRAGVVGSVARGAPGVFGGPRTWSLWPLAELTITHEHEDRLTFAGVLRVAPMVDRLTGLIDARAQGSFGFRWSFVPRWLLRAEAGVAQSLPLREDSSGLTLVLGEAVIGWIATHVTSLELGTRSAWQHLRGTDDPTPQWVVFGAVTFTSQPLRF